MTELSRFKVTPEGVVLTQTGLAKQTKPGKEDSLQLVTISRFREDKTLCSVECLKAYIRVTSCFRNMQGCHQLFLSYQAPHKPVQSSTITRWIKQILKASGLDTEMFSAHSTRGAASMHCRCLGRFVLPVYAKPSFLHDCGM